MPDVDAVMQVYQVARQAMVDAIAHDRVACRSAYQQCSALLEGRDTGAVAEALARWREALDAARWPEVSTRVWQLMCALPHGFPPDRALLPPQAGEIAQRRRPCPEHGDPPAGTWWAFCPYCGTRLASPEP